MAYASREALLGASDLTEADVELPSVGLTVKVRSLSAAYSNQASSEALELKTEGRQQIATVNTAKLEALQALHGLVEPKLNSLAEAEQFAKNCGPAFKEVIRVIVEISGVDKEAIDKANATFPVGGAEPSNGGSAQPVAAPAGGS